MYLFVWCGRGARARFAAQTARAAKPPQRRIPRSGIRRVRPACGSFCRSARDGGVYAVIPTAAFCGVGEETGELKAAAAEKRTVFRGFCWLCDISHAVQRRKAGDSAFSLVFAHFGDTVGAGRTRAVCAANRAGGEAAATPYSAKRNTARAPRVWEFLSECA